MTLKSPFSLSRALKAQKKLRRLVETVARQSWPLAKSTKAKKKHVRPQFVERIGFGSNPGRLKMKVYVPPRLARNSPLVVLLHGCLQTPESFDAGSGFSALAGRRRFALLCPQQSRSNNANLCFNWFRPSAVARDRGELMSIKQMIDTTISDHRLDGSRVYIAGLSAGGAMACALAATYPDMFDGVAIFAGLPFGAARDAVSALSLMRSSVERSALAWGDLVRLASPGATLWPPLSIWQGSDDRTVHPANAEAILSQWLDVTGLERNAAILRMKPWGRVERWQAGGRDLISYYRLDGFGHGLPVGKDSLAGVKGGRDRFVLPAGVSAPRELMKLWGL